MADIWHEVEIGAKPEKVYQALTEQEGLASWWTVGAKAEPTVGTTSEFPFMGGQFIIKMKVKALTPGKEVRWDVAQPGSASDWENTVVTWGLSPTENGTKVLFSHQNFPSVEGSLPNTSYHWAQYIASLKNYLETGKGNPHPA